MGRLNQFRTKLTPEEQKFLAEYETAIEELFDKLDAIGVLNKSFDEPKVERAMKVMQSSNVPADIFKNFIRLEDLPKREKDQILSDLDAKGFKVKNIPDQFVAVMCHMHQVMAERLKFHMVALIDFSKLNLKDADKTSLGPIINTLRGKFSNNKFINFLSTKIRNAVVHYSYYIKNGKLYLCNGYFDQNPSLSNKSKG